MIFLISVVLILGLLIFLLNRAIFIWLAGERIHCGLNKIPNAVQKQQENTFL